MNFWTYQFCLKDIKIMITECLNDPLGEIFNLLALIFRKRTFSWSKIFRERDLQRYYQWGIYPWCWETEMKICMHPFALLSCLGPCGNTQVQERMLKAGSKTSMVKGMHHWSKLIHGLHWAGPVEDSGVGMLWNDAPTYKAKVWVCGRGRRCY